MLHWGKDFCEIEMYTVSNGQKLSREKGHTPNSVILVVQDKNSLISVCGLPRPMSLVMRKPAFCICENKAADQLCSNRTADQCLCFCYIDSTIPLLSKSEISSI